MKLIPIMKRLIPVLMVISITMCIVSCEDEDSYSDITPERFYLERDLISYSDHDTYEWDTTLTQARVHFRVHDFVYGDISIRVRDADGRQIFFRLITTHDELNLIDDNDFEFTSTTAVGTPGLWQIKLWYDDVTGETRLTMD